MSTIYTNKMVNGVSIPLTPQEIAEFQQRELNFINNPPPLPLGPSLMQVKGEDNGSI
jgi:hypothetical protein